MSLKGELLLKMLLDGGTAMARIGILTCSNATQDLDCASASCLRDLRKRLGEFNRYPKDEKLELIGIINCAGCPTVNAAGKILRKVRSLAEMNVDSIHLTFCMVALCPFKTKYVEIIQEAYPNVNVVYGTHEAHVTPETFQQEVKEYLCQPQKDMTDIILKRARPRRS
ncbi:MAG TPA: CGGC domain-containing protein [Verrucomicrobiae bacterium]|nr:CGGC domain-containing protein [Verrucomicrobiae bacterium]